MMTSQESILLKQQRRFLLLTTTVVVVCSFSWGVAKGLSKQLQPAHASVFEPVSEEPSMPLAAGLQATQLGRNVQLNGGAAAAVSFSSERPLAEIVREQVALWQSLGFSAAGEVPGRKGIALAFHPQSGEKYSLVGVQLPKGGSAERRSQGLIVYGAGGWRDSAESQGALSGFPLMPGGRGGAVVSAQDPGGRTQTASYTNPGSVAESVVFYRELLTREGWSEISALTGGERGTAFGSLSVRRDRQEATLLFSSDQAKQPGGQEQTNAIVIVGQRGMFSGGEY